LPPVLDAALGLTLERAPLWEQCIMIDDVIAALEKDQRFSAWQVTEVRGRSTQRYQVFDSVESRRVVESRVCDVRVHVPHAGEEKLGESSFVAVDARSLPGALDAAFARARLVKNKPWTLPSPIGSDGGAGGATKVRAVDPRIVEAADDAAEDVGNTIIAAVKQRSSSESAVELSASEVFCDYRRVRLRNSKGLDLTREETSAYTEYVLLAKGKGSSDELEVYQSRRARDLKELALDEQIDDDVLTVRAGAAAVLPETAIADVVIGGAGTEEIFDAFVAHASGASAFDGWSRLKESASILSAAATGDTLSLSSDATLPGGLGTFAFDDVGLPGRRIDVVVNGVFQTRACDQRYACWLGVPATGSWGNTVVQPGRATEAELLVPASPSRPLYQLLRFSQLSPHATTGAFSGEIRFGWRIDVDAAGKITRTPIRGGSVSGVVFDAFARARFSKETATRGRTHGPRAVRFDSLQITGG
jgi:predicted Zn-dependent protease